MYKLNINHTTINILLTQYENKITYLHTKCGLSNSSDQNRRDGPRAFQKLAWTEIDRLPESNSN